MVPLKFKSQSLLHHLWKGLILAAFIQYWGQNRLNSQVIDSYVKRTGLNDRETCWVWNRANDKDPELLNWWFFLYSTSLFTTLSDIFTWCIISILSILPVSDNSSASVSWSRTGRSPRIDATHSSRFSRFDSHLFIDFLGMPKCWSSAGLPSDRLGSSPRDLGKKNGAQRHRQS